jgi:sugar/nucleoside kinase (ribokinase family)
MLLDFYTASHSKPLDECGRLGGIASAEVISHFGARPETPLKELAAAAQS